MSAQELHDIMAGLEANSLTAGYSHLLSGYVASAAYVRAVAATYDKLKLTNPNLKWVCDPVLGDNGNLYVAPELVAAYVQYALPKAFMITPNQFEAEQLSGVTIKNEDDVKNCIDILLNYGPKYVIITSTEFNDNKEFISLYAASKNDNFST